MTFDVRKLRKPVFDALLHHFFNYRLRECWMPIYRCCRPIGRLPLVDAIWVFRDEHVREVLAHDREFPVPFAARMMEIAGGRNFVLGMEDGPEYRRNYAQLAKAFQRDDVPTHVVPAAARASQAVLRGRSRLDAVRDLIWAVPAQLCEDYFGIEVPDRLLLADWTVAMSTYVFDIGDTPSPLKRDLAMTAAGGFRDLIRIAIRNTRRGAGKGVVLQRLIEMQNNDRQLTNDVLEAHLFGMVTGLIPTNLLAGGNILDTLLSRTDFLKRTQNAARVGDAELWRHLRETLRFRHINPGPLRTCGPAGYTLADGTPHARYISPGTKVLASTQSAMFDGRKVKRPRRFNPDRPADDFLIFGYGQHWCLGAYIAIAQLTQTFKALLLKKNLRRATGAAGKLQRVSIFPANLTVEYEP